VGSEYIYAVNSGTTALHVTQMSILEQEDEVIVSDLAFFATASTVVLAGGRPVFADIDEKTLNVTRSC
jgi:dTDP-4-amino-4,6-dideoxygalactose transaminase